MSVIYDSIYSLTGLKFNLISLLCALWLSVYFILSFTLFLSRYFTIKSWIRTEQESLENIMMGRVSIIKSCLKNAGFDLTKLEISKNIAIKNATKGMSLLSVVSSTSPFIGLFGTVVSILITFGEFSSTSSVGFNVLAPKISEALVVTAFGILVAIPAYSFYILIKRKVFELSVILDNETQILNRQQVE